MFGDLRLALFEQYIEYLAVDFYAFVFEAVHIPEKFIAQNQIREYFECLDFAHNYRQYYNRIGHALHITDIRTQQMEYLQNLLHLSAQNFFVVVV